MRALTKILVAAGAAVAGYYALKGAARLEQHTVSYTTVTVRDRWGRLVTRRITRRSALDELFDTVDTVVLRVY